MSDDSGEYYVCCDVCGFNFRASQTRMRWDRLRVCDADWESRHPQDSVKALRDRQSVPNARPEPTDTFSEPGDVTSNDL